MEPLSLDGWQVVYDLSAGRYHSSAVLDGASMSANMSEQNQSKEECAKVSVGTMLAPAPANASPSPTKLSSIEVTKQREKTRAVPVIAYDANQLDDECATSSVAVQSANVMEDASMQATSPDQRASAVNPSPCSTSEHVHMGMLRKELREAHNQLDYLLLIIFLTGVCLLFDSLIPVRTMGVGFAAAVGPMWWLGALEWRGAMILLINVVILVPFNTVNFVVYWVSYPLRMLFYQTIQFILIPLITGGKSLKPFKDATFAELLRVMPHFFSFLMTGLDPKYRAFGDNIDDATSDQAREAMIHAPVFHLMNEVLSNVPKGLLNSIVFRLIVQMLILPTLGWWWAGWCYIPLLPLRSEQEGADVPSPLPPVQIKFTECKWLKVASESFGEDIGKAKCLNE